MRRTFKRFAARLPYRIQQDMKRVHMRRQIGRGGFLALDPEYDLLGDLVSEGDWAVDVGANVGHYTLRLSKLVGPTGRVIAFEPMAETLELLAGNVERAPYRNTTVVGAAASEECVVVHMELPKFDTGLDNYYEAHITSGTEGQPVLCLSIDSLHLTGRVTVVKIDAEGHDVSVLRGMHRLLERDHPTLIVEELGPGVQAFLEPLGYRAYLAERSPNQVLVATDDVAAIVESRGYRLRTPNESA